jgi:hypothetical protein
VVLPTPPQTQLSPQPPFGRFSLAAASEHNQPPHRSVSLPVQRSSNVELNGTKRKAGFVGVFGSSAKRPK